jgi:hypothetical protein
VEAILMTDSERQHLVDLRRVLLHLHKTLLDWERVAYDRQHGRTSPNELLSIVMRDPHFAWLHPLSELIVRIDTMLDVEHPEPRAEVEAILRQARALVSPDESGTPYAQRYHTALQEHPDAVLAHGQVAMMLKRPARAETRH